MSLAQQRVGRVMPGTFAAVIRAYIASTDFTGRAKATQNNYQKVLKVAEMESGLGGCSVQVIRPAIIQAFLDGLAHKPGIQSIAKTALGAVERFAVVRDLVPHPFMTGTRVVGSETGHEPWSFEQVAIAIQFARPDLSRAVILALHTGQRGSDIIRMCPTDIEQKLDPITGVFVRGINVRQKKTDVRLWIPFTDEFDEILATWERQPGPFLRKPDGSPYTRPELSCAWNYELLTNENLTPLKGLVLHGLRATAIVWRRKCGLNALQIASMVGMSLPMVERYCRLANKSELALAAIHFLNGTVGERQLSTIRKVER